MQTIVDAVRDCEFVIDSIKRGERVKKNHYHLLQVHYSKKQQNN